MLSKVPNKSLPKHSLPNNSLPGHSCWVCRVLHSNSPRIVARLPPLEQIAPKSLQAPLSWKYSLAMFPRLVRIAKWLIVALVLLALTQTLRQGMRELSSQHQQLAQQIATLDNELLAISTPDPNSTPRAELTRRRDALREEQVSLWWIRPQWALASLTCSIAGLLPLGLFWRSTLVSFGYRTPLKPTLGLYFGGNLGKYVPGKAMVVLLRTTGLKKFGVPVGPSILSIFVETLLSMAIAGVLGGLALAFLKAPPWLILASLLFVLAAGIPTLPPVFRWSVALLWKLKARRSHPTSQPPLDGLDWKLWRRSWLWITTAWLLNSLGLWCLMMGMTSPSRQLELQSLLGFQTALAATTLAVVAGFISFLPGGAGVREYVMSVLLAPLLGAAPALAIAVWMRLISLSAEFLLALWSGGIPLLLRGPPQPASPSIETSATIGTQPSS